MHIRWYLKQPIFWLARIKGIGYTGCNHLTLRGRLRIVLSGLIGLAEGAVAVISLGTFAPDWEFMFIFSDFARKLEE